MSGETPLTVTGNLTADPVLRYTSTGTAFATFTVASTARFLDQADAEWKDGDALFMRCSVWRQQAERAVQTLTKGSRVVVTGRLRQRTYEADDGGSRTVVELAADEVGPSLRYASVTITKTHRHPSEAVAEVVAEPVA
jgi:single-strand DNA-binding protein